MFIKFISFVILYLFLCEIEGQLHIECVTPNNETATCESIYTCKTFIDVIKNSGESQKKFMRQSLCGYFNLTPVVCCGSQNDYKISTRSKREVDFTFNSAIPDEATCGISEKDSTNGSHIALWGQFPWSARIQFNRTNKFGCEGTLINSRYVLTAGICLDEKTFKRVGHPIKVRLGQHNCPESNVNCKDEHIDVGIEELIHHKDYGFSGSLEVKHDDIGLIRLDKDVSFSDAIRPVCLPKPNDTPLAVGEIVTETGWYRNSQEQLKTEAPVASLEVCTRVYQKQAVTVTKTHLCAGGLSNGTCAGTSGGSLLKYRQDKGYLEGIISFGPVHCDIGGWPTVYTNVRPYLEWIHSNVKP